MPRPPPRSPLFPYTTLFRSYNSYEKGYETTFHQTDDIKCDTQEYRSTNHCTDSCEQGRSEEHTSELQSRFDLVCRLLLEKKNKQNQPNPSERIHNHNQSQTN